MRFEVEAEVDRFMSRSVLILEESVSADPASLNEALVADGEEDGEP